ncbi:AHH domain-containing protein [Bradyrhizobium sp. TM233]|uniref:AHH domain-containing protein n=1 Tax=Bradyrhizobium sp. TM233 TaxID=2599801 RepID=UPI0030C70836
MFRRAAERCLGAAPEGSMFQIHHILPRSLVGHRALKVLSDRFNLDGIKNLMHLPSDQKAAHEVESSPHTGGHLGSYNKVFCKFLGELEAHPSFAAAQQGDTAALDQLDAEMGDFLAAAKHALARGHLLTNTPVGMTREDANKRIENWYANWRTYAKDNQDSILQMRDTVDQLHSAGEREGALRAPVLLPHGNLSLADKIAILKRYSDSSPISQHFAAVGPVPDLPGFEVPPFDARLPGFVPPATEDLNRPEGFLPSNPLLQFGLPGFPAINPQGFGQLPPTTAVPQDPLVLKFDPATGWALPFSERSPILDPDPPSQATPPAGLYKGAGLAAAAVFAPEFLPLWARMGVAGLAASAPTLATAGTGGGVFSTGQLPYDPFKRDQTTSNSYVGSPSSDPWANVGVEQTTAVPPTVNRRGDQDETSKGPTQQSQALQSEASGYAASVAPEDVRRLARVNESNAGSVFTSGSAAVPYLPSTEFNERFGSWAVPTANSGRSQPSKPIAMFADEPSYLVPPPIFGVDGSGQPHGDAEEWFSRWIRPLLRQE